MKKIYENLYQFTTYIPSMDFTIHQYLLTSDPAIVFATGTQKEAAENLATIKEVLGERTVKYIFVSHKVMNVEGFQFSQKNIQKQPCYVLHFAQGSFPDMDLQGK